MPEVNLKLTSDSRSAEVGIERTTEKLADANKELKKFVAGMAPLGDMAAEWIKGTKAIEAQAAAIRKARAEQKEMAAAQRERAGMISAVPGLSGVGSLMSGSAAAAGAAALGAGLASVAAMGHMFAAGQNAEQSISRIDQHTGGRGQQVFTAMEDLAGRFGGDSQELLAQSERLVRSGFSSEQAVKVMEHVLVAAQGDVARMAGLLDELVEAASRGYIEESLLSNLDKNGVNVRQALMEHLSMSKDQLEEALSKGEVDVSTYLGLIDQLTGAGTDAYEASKKASETTLGQLSQIWSEWKSAWAGMGRALDQYIIRPLADKVLPLAKEYFSWLRKFWDGPDVTESIISETPEAYKKLYPAEEGKDKIQQRFEAQQKLKEEKAAREKQQQAENEAWSIRRGLQNSRADAVWAGMSLAERRASIGRNTGLGEGVSLDSLDEKILSSEGYTNANATAEQVAQLRLLVNERKRLVELLKQESVELEKVQQKEEQREDMIQEAEQRRLLQEAELAGEKERVRLLKEQAEAARLYNQYIKAGVESGKAMQLASAEIARKRAIQDMNAKRSEGSRVSGWLESELSAVGGGGIRVRNYEAGAVDIARDTKENTADIATTAEKIFEYLQKNHGASAAVLL